MRTAPIWILLLSILSFADGSSSAKRDTFREANRQAIPVAMETPAATDLAVPKDPNTKSRNPSARVNTHTEPASVEYRAGKFIAVKPIANAMEARQSTSVTVRYALAVGSGV